MQKIKLIEVNGELREHVWNPTANTGTPYKSDIGTIRYPRQGCWVLTAQSAIDIMYERDGMKDE